jgi:hypothetical protein
MSDLLKILNVVISLSLSDRSSAFLCVEQAVSVPTLKRYLAEARHLGADITSIKSGSRWHFHLANWDQCQKRVLSWAKLERERTFL